MAQLAGALASDEYNLSQVIIIPKTSIMKKFVCVTKL